MLLFFTAQWCQYCHQMAAEAFTNPQVVGLSEKFVCVLVDADSQPEICRQFHVSAFPTVQFVSPQGFLLNRIEGKRPGHQVMMAMQSALQTAALRSQPKGFDAALTRLPLGEPLDWHSSSGQAAAATWPDFLTGSR